MKTDRALVTGVLLFDDVEDLDFAGPVEVFSVANRLANTTHFTLVTLATKTPVRTTAGLSVNVDQCIPNDSSFDLLIVPGGSGVRVELENESVLKWVQIQAAKADYVLSICTGALLLAKAGLLKGLNATTHPAGAELLQTIEPTLIYVPDVRFVRNDKILVAGGVASGIDGALATVADLVDADLARRIALHIQYPSLPS